MDDQQTVITHYAILIGINDYPGEPLKGCVRDVRDIEKYLKQIPKPPEIQIFTAPLVEDLDSSEQAENRDSSYLTQGSASFEPTKSPELRPTYSDVTSSLKRVTSRAKAGDFVYIHYSGHGTTIESSNEFSNGSTRDLALVLLDGVTRHKLRCLKGLELASMIGDMVQKELIVTLVLDCCFSGSVMRGDSLTRYLSYDPEVHGAYCSAAGSSLETRAGNPISRDASMRPNWLVDPKGYTILTACGPTEKAKELCDEKRQRHGVLSYFLLRSLKKLGNVRETQQLIYHHLRARFRETQEERRNEQNPILYGKKTLSFFGPAGLGLCSAPVSIIKRSNGSLQIEAGRAHGVCSGDQFIVYPWSSNERDSNSEDYPIVAKVNRVGALVSDLELLNTSVRVQTGWVATMRSPRSFQTFLLRLDSSLPRQNEWLAALKERSLDAKANQDGGPASFHIRLSSNNEYEVFNESDSKLANIPTMKHDQTDISLACDVVEHLAKFKIIRDLINEEPTGSFLESFSIHIDFSEKTFPPGSLVRKQDGQKFKLEVENSGTKNLYLYIYNLGPRWQVKNLLRANHKVIPPRIDSQGSTGKASMNLLQQFHMNCAAEGIASAMT